MSSQSIPIATDSSIIRGEKRLVMIKYANEVRGQFIFLKNGKHANEPPGGE